MGLRLPLGPATVTPELEAIVLSAGTAGVVGALGAWATVRVARRSLATATLVGPAVVVASIAAGVLVTAQAMFLSSHDLTLVWLLVAAAVPVALACGFFLYRAVRAIDRRTAEAAAQREREQALAASRREMVTWASHDLRSPLAGIRAMAEALEDGVVQDPDAYHRRIRHESDRMARMVDDLLEMSLLQHGEQLLRRRPVDLSELARDVAQGQVPVAERLGVRLDLPVADPVRVEVDPSRLERAVANVVRNALLATPRGGLVTVRSGRQADAGGQVAFVEVDDACGGLSPEDLRRAFDPGWRGSAPRTPEAGAGAGVGLTITRAVVEEHGGTVRLTNHGAGCRLRLCVPLTPAG
jgi:signal transduction histidine kinase